MNGIKITSEHDMPRFAAITEKTGYEARIRPYFDESCFYPMLRTTAFDGWEGLASRVLFLSL